VVTETLLEVRGVTKSYSGKVVLRRVSFSVMKSDFIMIIGPSGSGKTTLLGIIAGLEQPDSGDIFFLGQKLSELSEEKLSEYRNRHIGFIFQNYNLIPFLTAIENVSVPMIFAGINEKKALQRAKELLIQVGLGDMIHNFPNQLSGGEQQRVAIARALANDPEIILADEPTANLDEENEKIIMKILSGITKNGKSIIFVTHKSELAEYATKVFKLVNGRLIEL